MRMHATHTSSSEVLTVGVHVQGRISGWLQDTVGFHPSALHPSVRCGLEGALLTALAAARGQTLAGLLTGGAAPVDQSSLGRERHLDFERGAPAEAAVAVNGLLDCAGAPEDCAAEAAALAERGFSAVKMKVKMSSLTTPCISC